MTLAPVLVLLWMTAVPPVALEKAQGSWAPTWTAARDTAPLEALAREVDHAWEERHLDDASAVMSFPVWMVTDDGKGNATSASWSRETWLKVMGDFANQLGRDATFSTSKRTIRFLTEALAIIEEEKALRQGGRTTRWKRTSVCARQEGRWLITAVVEGGWSAAEKH